MIRSPGSGYIVGLSREAIEAKLFDFSQLLKEWVDRYERLGVPRYNLLAQMRTVLVNLEDEEGIVRSEDQEAKAK